MNRNVLSWLTILLISFTSLILFYQNNYNRQNIQVSRIYNLNNSFYNFKTPELHNNSSKDYKYQLTTINNTAKKLHLNYIKRSRYAGWNLVSGNVDYNSPVQKVDFQTSDNNHLLDKHFERINQVLISQDHNKYKINTGLNEYKINVEPIFNTINDKEKHDGDYFLETDNKNLQKQFLLLLSKEFSYHYNHKINYKSLESTETNDLTLANASDLDNIRNTLITFLFLFIIIFLIIHSKELLLYKLYGISSIKSFKLSMGNIIIKSLIIVSILDFLINKILKWNFNITVFFEQFLLLIAIILISISLIDFLQSLLKSNKEKNKNTSIMLFIIFFIIKGLSITICLFSMLPLYKVFSNSYNINKNNIVQQHYAVFNPVTIGNDHNNHTLHDAKKLDSTMYPILNKMGSLLIDDSIVNQNINNSIKYVIINPNYLNAFPLYDKNNKRIKISNSEKKLIFCVPYDRKKYVNNLISYAKYISKNELHKNKKIRIIYTKSNYNKKFLDINNNKSLAKDTLMISTKNNSSFVERNIMNGQGNEDALKVPIIENTMKTYNKIKPYLIKNSYLDNYPQLVKMSSSEQEDLKMSIGNIWKQNYIIITTFIITMIFSLYSIMLFFNAFKYSIIIKRINGLSLYKSYKILFLLLIIQYLITLFSLMYLQSINVNTLTLYFIVLIIEIIVTTISIKILERKRKGSIIDGK